jgi:hypothetical protein
MEPLAELAKHVVSYVQGAKRFPSNKWKAVRLADNPTLVLPSEAALILGEEPSYGIPAFYASREEILPDGVYLLGDDLTQLGPQTSYARLVFVKLRNFFSYDKDDAFDRIKAIKDLEKTLLMEGIGIQDSQFDKQETLLFKHDNFERLNFEAIGDNYINLFKTNSDVDKVAVVFVTVPSFPYVEVKKQAILADRTLEVMTYLGHAPYQCSSCAKKPFCDAVPGLRDLHVARSNAK